MQSIEIKLPLTNPQSSDSRLSKEVLPEFKKGCEIIIWDNAIDWQTDEEAHIFQLWIEYAQGNDHIMFETDLDDLEMFANSLIKRIEMIRRDYRKTIQQKIANRQPL